VSHIKYGKNNPYQNNNINRGTMRFHGRKIPQTPARSDEPPPPPPSGYEYIPPNNSYLPPDVSLLFLYIHLFLYSHYILI